MRFVCTYIIRALGNAPFFFNSLLAHRSQTANLTLTLTNNILKLPQDNYTAGGGRGKGLGGCDEMRWETSSLLFISGHSQHEVTLLPPFVRRKGQGVGVLRSAPDRTAKHAKQLQKGMRREVAGGGTNTPLPLRMSDHYDEIIRVEPYSMASHRRQTHRNTLSERRIHETTTHDSAGFFFNHV